MSSLLIGLVLLIHLPASRPLSPQTRKSQEVSKALKREGNITIGGLFPLHVDGSSEGKQCGRIKGDKGIQRMEAMLYAVKKINEDQTLLPGIRLGVQILDTCSQDTHALEQTLEFIKTAISSNMNDNRYTCPDGIKPIYNQPNPTVAVIGAASSQVSSMVANMLRLFKFHCLWFLYPEAVYPASIINDRIKQFVVRWNHDLDFSRVVPSDTLQAKAMVSVVESLDWNYVHAIADEGTYGEKGIESFRKHAAQRGTVCLGEYEKIRRDFKDEEFQGLLKKLKQKENTRGVIMFVGEDNVKKILRAARSLNMLDHFAWVASDSWGTKRAPVADSLEKQSNPANGAITIQSKRKPVREFDDYFTSLTRKHTEINPWFEEFWLDKFNCTNEPIENCPGNLLNQYVQESYVPFVMDAVNLLAHALKSLLEEKCNKFSSLTACLRETKIPFDGTELLYHIRNASFDGVQGDRIELDASGDRTQGTYSIFQYRAGEYTEVGEWGDTLRINKSLVEMGFGERGVPTSVCSNPCAIGQYRIYINPSCCWVCKDCNKSSIIINETRCEACPLGLLPNVYKNECIPMIPNTLEWTSLWAIIPAAFSVLGILCTGVVIYVFIRYNKTPVVMASGRELCYFMIAGIMCSYFMTFVLVNPPNRATCGILRVGIGLFMCAIYAAILTKISRLARIFTSDIKSAARPRFITPKAQVGICAMIISVQFFGACIWLAVDPPTTIHLYPSRLVAVLSCKTTATPLLLSLTYNMVLIILCTVYAFKTRKIPENFNETKYIGFTMYATCIVWLAFIPIYFATNHNFRIQITSLCMCISISGSVALWCFFAPKVYIVLFQPYKNVRQGTYTGFQRLVAHQVAQQMRFVNHLAPNATPPNPNDYDYRNKNEYDQRPPIGSYASQGSYNPSMMSSTSVTEQRSEVSVHEEPRTHISLNPLANAKRRESGGPKNTNHMPFPVQRTLSPMKETAGDEVGEGSPNEDGEKEDDPFLKDSNSQVPNNPQLHKDSVDSKTEPGEEEEEAKESTKLLEHKRESEQDERSDVEDERESGEIDFLIAKDSWTGSETKAEIEMILTEIASQEGTVV